MTDEPGFKWPNRFLELARQLATWSKDPTTKVGAVARDRYSKAVLETGYNGLPRGVDDHPARMERPRKYLWTAHAEENLVAHAARKVLEGSTVTVTHLCCCACTRMLINAGVRRIELGPGTWGHSDEQFPIVEIMCREAGVELVMVL